MGSRKTGALKETVALALLPGAMLFAVHLFFIASHLYEWHFAWLDTPMHLVGGAVSAWAAWVFWLHLRRTRALPELPGWFRDISVLGVVAIIGILWEFSEFLTDEIRATLLQGSVADTMKDFANDLLGAIFFLLAVRRRRP